MCRRTFVQTYSLAGYVELHPGVRKAGGRRVATLPGLARVGRLFAYDVLNGHAQDWMKVIPSNL